MVIVNSYALAVFLCFIIMLCWGSWGNTQKLAAKSWRYELFYWDYVIGMVLFALLLALTPTWTWFPTPSLQYFCPCSLGHPGSTLDSLR